MHPKKVLRLTEWLSLFQFPLLGIFPCITLGLLSHDHYGFGFQFPLLGIFPCIVGFASPPDWLKSYFQFPLLGIFPCIRNCDSISQAVEKLSIPSTWDFSMHLQCSKRLEHSEQFRLSIPSTWDFSMHHLDFRFCKSKRELHFQFPLLGIFPCISRWNVRESHGVGFFQFPLLGIFPCIFPHKFRHKELTTSFNSLYLGFFHASNDTSTVTASVPPLFQFPLLGIFPCIHGGPQGHNDG